MVGLAGCNLRPLHGGDRGFAANAELAAIDVNVPESRIGQIIKNQLLDDLNPAGTVTEALYDLDVSLDLIRTALAIQLDDTTTRFDLTLSAIFILKDKVDQDTLYRSAVRRVSSYNVVRDPFATEIAERDAERRAAREVSRQIRTLLSLHFEGLEG